MTYRCKYLKIISIGLLQILGFIIVLAACTMAFSYIIKVFVWFGTKSWEFNLYFNSWTIHVSLVPGMGDLIIGGSCVILLVIAILIIDFCGMKLCPSGRERIQQLQNTLVNVLMNQSHQQQQQPSININNDNDTMIPLDEIENDNIDDSSSSGALFSSDNIDTSFDDFINKDDDIIIATNDNNNKPISSIK